MAPGGCPRGSEEVASTGRLYRMVACTGICHGICHMAKSYTVNQLPICISTTDTLTKYIYIHIVFISLSRYIHVHPDRMKQKNMFLKLILSVMFFLSGYSRARCPSGMNATGTLKDIDGDAMRYVASDLAKIRLRIEGNAPTMAEATALGKRLLDNVTKRLEGLESAGMKSSNFEWEAHSTDDLYFLNGKNGYTFSQTLDIMATVNNSVQVIETARVDEEDGIEVAHVIHYVSTEKKMKVLNEMKTEAMRNAMEAAEMLAKEAGGKVGSIISVSDSAYLTPIPSFDSMDDSEELISASVYLEAELCM